LKSAAENAELARKGDELEKEIMKVAMVGHMNEQMRLKWS
jgi:hypothetical protein